MRALLVITALAICVALTSALVPNGRELAPEAGLNSVLSALGETVPDHVLSNPTEAQIQMGHDLIFEGKVQNPPEGKASRFISPYFSCTSCHNSVRETSDLNQADPEDRLAYAQKHDLPFLQGSTFWGIVNRRTWYNDDYVLKYGELVVQAKNSLRESTQLCAEVCSQGRTLDEWELDAILAYYSTLEITLADLHLSKDDWNVLQHGSEPDALSVVKSKYLEVSPATFGHMPEDLRKGYGLTGRPEQGKFIYENGCQHCHRPEGESGTILDNYPTTFKWLNANMYNWDDLGLYHIVRKGTYAEKGAKAYMPHYTDQKMSDQQLEDLRAYIELMAKGE